jgi:hypothetical protein
MPGLAEDPRFQPSKIVEWKMSTSGSNGEAMAVVYNAYTLFVGQVANLRRIGNRRAW